MERITAVVAALLVVTAGVAAPVAAATDPDDESASFGEDAYVTVTRGDSVDISVSHSTKANLTIGTDSDGFNVTVPLGGSGTDTITLDTYNTTSRDPSAFLNVDNAELESEPIDEAIEPGEYRLSVTVQGDELARGTLDVQPRDETTGAPGVAPDDLNFEESEVGGVFDAITERDTVARDDYAVALVNESGLSWALPEASTDADLADDIEASVVELDPEPNTAAEEFHDFHVASRVGDADQFAVFWNADVPVTRNSNNTYELRLTLDESSALVDEDETLVRERVRVVEPRVDLSASPSFTLAPWDDRALRVSGQTNLAPTTSLDVRSLRESPSEGLYRHVVPVDRDGSFATDFTFSGATVPQELPLWVLNYRSESEETVSLTEADASLSFADQRADEQSVTVENVSLSHGGFVEVTGNLTGNGSSTVGVSAHLDGGDHGSVSVPLVDALENETELTATAVADANRNTSLDDGDASYEVNGSVIAANATVQPALESANNTTTTTTPAANNTTTTQRSLDVDESEPLAPNQASGGSSSGTVPLSPALVAVALAAAALLAGRR